MTQVMLLSEILNLYQALILIDDFFLAEISFFGYGP